MPGPLRGHQAMVQASRRWALTRAFLFLAATAGLGACVADPGGSGYPGYGRTPPLVGGGQPGPLDPRLAPTGRRVAILVPLTGQNAELGQAMLRAAQLAMDQPGAPPLDARDTGGTPEGAVNAARTALEGGAGIILGPLTSPETAAVAPVAKAAGVPVLAFTSDAAQAQPGIWTLGITPAQQVRRLVLAVQSEGKTRLAAVVPQNPFGDALADGMVVAAATAGMGEPRILRYPGGANGLNAALRDVSGSNGRRGDTDEVTRRDAPAAGVDALLLGAAGDQLGQAAPLLASYGIGPSQVRILGPAIWAREAPRLRALAGAWYAAPDPAQRGPFERQYAAKHYGPPRELASLAFDAASIARVTADRTGFPVGSLMRPDGFAGADGVFALQPDGGVRRGLAIFEIDTGGSHVVQPAPQTLSAPGT